MYESLSGNAGGRLFHTKGSEAEKAQSASLVCVPTVVAADRRGVLLESVLKCTKSEVSGTVLVQ